jgi:hypothetical protein
MVVHAAIFWLELTREQIGDMVDLETGVAANSFEASASGSSPLHSVEKHSQQRYSSRPQQDALEM